MKKIVQRMLLAALCLLCAFFAFQGITDPGPPPARAVVDSSHAVTEFHGVTMKLMQESVSASDKRIAVTIQNHSDFAFGCGEQWQLERYEEGAGFVLCPYKEQPSFTAIWCDISPGGNSVIGVDLTYFSPYLCPGRYRVVVGPCIIEEVGEKSFYPATAHGTDRFVLCLEFDIT